MIAAGKYLQWPLKPTFVAWKSSFEAVLHYPLTDSEVHEDSHGPVLGLIYNTLLSECPQQCPLIMESHIMIIQN